MSSTVSRVVIIGQFFPPSNESMALYMGDIADALAAQGVEVTAVAAREDAPYRGPVRRRSIPVPCRHARSLWVRGIQGVTFSLVAAWYTWLLARPATVILCVSTPPFAAFATYPIARIRGASFVWLEYDIYPEIAANVAAVPRPLMAVWQRLRDRVRRGVDRIIVPSSGMADFIRSSTPGAATVDVVRNWADERIKPLPRSENPLTTVFNIHDGDMVVLYSGTVGAAHVEPLLSLVEAASRLDPDGLRWLFVGGGRGRSCLDDEIRARGLKNVTVLDRQPADRVPLTLTLGDVAVVALDRRAVNLLYPSKIYGYLAAGIPILVLCEVESDLDREIVDVGAGWRVSPTDVEGLVALFRHLRLHPEEVTRAGEAARRQYLTGGRERGTTEYADILVPRHDASDGHGV